MTKFTKSDICNPMDFNELRIFKAVAEEGSVSRAAERMNCVQSNVTARIRQLEESLNATLFHRKSRGVALTPAGRILLDYAERILALANEAERIVQEREPLGGRLIIGALETTAAVRLPPVLAEYHRKFPSVDLQLVTGTALDLIQRILDFKLDGTFVDGSVDHPELIVEDCFVEENVLLCAVGEDPLTKERPINILAFPIGCYYRKQLETWLHKSGLIPYKIMEFSTIETIIGCVSAGMGITFLPRSVLSGNLASDKIAIHSLPAEVSLVTTRFLRRKNSLEPKTLSAFREIVRQFV
ncbi:MAG TPA: LysR family transcriptional regulator [Geobacteraceae bacterium]|nr:LysR family transcriptional regulator [Geobacteraceae bacterium]